MAANGSTGGRSVGFFQGCKEELSKVTAPTRQEATQATIVTIVMVAVVSCTLAVFDLIFKELMGVLLAG